MSRRTKTVRHPLAADLSEMLSYCRPHTSTTMEDFCDRYLAPLPGAYCDKWGNWHASVGDSPRVLWSTHTDTVHTHAGRQRVDVSHGFARLSARSDRNCLGADDTAGVWLALELHRRGIPGRYVFHFGEERGGIGSGALAHHHADWLQETSIAIALDRAGFDDVITRQGGSRTCSDRFANTLGARIGMGYSACPHGIYTDTAEYADLIPECTNLSVGYEHAHSSSETLDLDHLWILADRLSEVDYDALPVERTPGDDDRPTVSRWMPRVNGTLFDDSGDDSGDGDDHARLLPLWADAGDDWRQRDDAGTVNGTYLHEDYQRLVREYYRTDTGRKS